MNSMEDRRRNRGSRCRIFKTRENPGLLAFVNTNTSVTLSILQRLQNKSATVGLME
jgi:hypothetical protein